MPTVKIKCAVIGYHFNTMVDGAIYWSVASSHSGQLDDKTLHVQNHEFEVDVPDINVTAQQVASLEAAKVEALKQYQQRVADINERLSKLQCLEAA